MDSFELFSIKHDLARLCWEDFLTGQPDFFTETAVTPTVEKSFPRWEINRHAKG